jgi:APA family basic amino acid/polyamine antiporter
VGALDLTALGLGAIIGTGIFVVIGPAIGTSGPSIVLSFVLAAVTCAFSALSYAELASTIPVSGSAYTYGYATLGELVAWIIGWDLILEYGVAVGAVAVGWGGNFNELLDILIGSRLPDAISQPPEEGGVVNLPAIVIVLAVTALLCVGVRESTRANTVMVFVKIAVLTLFIALAATAFTADNFSPFFADEGLNGTVAAAAIIFFAYIGFDAVSTAGEEVKRPQRDLPLGIIGSLLIATIFYILVAGSAIGALPPAELEGAGEAPLVAALRDGAGFAWAGGIIAAGAVVSITSVILAVLYGQTRIFFAMCRDGLLPRGLARVNPRTRTPVLITAGFGILIAVLAALVPLGVIVELVNIGTLFAFVIVNIGVILLRRTQPDMERGFRVPFVPVVPAIGILLCVYLMSQLPFTTWVRFGIWLGLGVLIYFLYGRRHSLLQQGRAINPEAELPEP